MRAAWLTFWLGLWMPLFDAVRYGVIRRSIGTVRNRVFWRAVEKYRVVRNARRVE